MSKQPAARASRAVSSPYLGPTLKQRRIQAGLAVAAVAAMLVAAIFVRELPWAAQKLAGMLFAAAAATAFVKLLGVAPRPDDNLAGRLRPGQSLDFGKELRTQRPPRRRMVKLPGVGEIRIATLGAIAIFIAALAWWWSPAAPLKVRAAAIGDLWVAMGEEIAAGALMLADPHAAVVAPPLFSESLRKEAARIKEKDPPLQRALAAAIRGQCDQARAMLEDAAAAPEAPLARAQIELCAGRYDEAANQYAEVVKATTDNPLVFYQAAMAALLAGETAKAETWTTRAARLQRDKPADDPLVPLGLHAQAVVGLERGKTVTEAVGLGKQALEAYRQRDPSETSLAVAVTYNNQGVVFALRGDYAPAAETLQLALDHFRRGLPAGDPRTALAQYNLAVLNVAAGEYKAAEEGLGQARAVFDEKLPEGHALRSAVRSSQARLFALLARFDEAQKTAEEALTAAEKSLGADHPLIASAADNLAAAYAAKSLYALAHKSAIRGLSLTERLWGDQHPFMAPRLIRVTEIQFRQGRYDEASQRCRAAAKLATAVYSTKHPLVAEAQAWQGRAAIARGQPRDARGDLLEAKKKLEETFARAADSPHNKEHPELARVLGDLAALDNSPTTYDRGIAGYSKAIAMMEDFFGPEHPEVARLLQSQAALFLNHATSDAKAIDEALACLDRARKIQEQLPPYHPDLATTADLYARAYEAKSPPDAQAAKASRDEAQQILSRHREEDQLVER